LEVPAESAAAKAGLRKGDVILSINGEKTADTATLLKQAPTLSVGQPWEIGVSRDQKRILIQMHP
jgi:S1-C subfamily serine protease